MRFEQVRARLTNRLLQRLVELINCCHGAGHAHAARRRQRRRTGGQDLVGAIGKDDGDDVKIFARLRPQAGPLVSVSP